jgi:hypothetical protein
VYSGANSSRPVAIAAASGGGWLVGGDAHTSSTDSRTWLLLKITAGGSLDETFDRTTKRVRDWEGGVDKVSVDENGYVTAAGQMVGNGRGRSYAKPILVRFNSSGALDRQFGRDGIFDAQSIAPRGRWVGLFPQSRGLSLAAIRTVDTTRIVRINDRGTVDRSFGEHGVLDLGHPYSLVAVDSSRRILASASMAPGDLHELELRRYQVNGVPDDNFGERGVVSLDDSFEGSTRSSIQTMSIDRRDRITLSLSDPKRKNVHVVRLLPEGKLDHDFSNDGQAEFPLGGSIADADTYGANRFLAVAHTGLAYPPILFGLKENGGTDKSLGSGPPVHAYEIELGFEVTQVDVMAVPGEQAVIVAGSGSSLASDEGRLFVARYAH